jgi:hypothetical protein
MPHNRSKGSLLDLYQINLQCSPKRVGPLGTESTDILLLLLHFTAKCALRAPMHRPDQAGVIKPTFLHRPELFRHA